MAAPVLTSDQARAIARCAKLAVARRLTIVGQGTCRVPGHEGARVWAVSSASRANHAHLVWIEGGRLLCSCEARRMRGYFTCSHAQAVRLRLVEERGGCRPIAVPFPAMGTPQPDPDPEPQPPTPGGTPPGGEPPRCPTCGQLADPDEITQLGECLACLEAAAALEVGAPYLCDCGATATGETAEGFICDACAAERERARRASVRTSVEAARQRATEAAARRRTGTATRRARRADR